jgi:citrate lyase subunit beta / citryl-CoA lyase
MSEAVDVSAIRPRRSVLYMPGSNARAMEKARDIACDAVILDLEDAVAPDAKELARAQVAEAVAAGFGRREVVVRINGLVTPWGADDLAAATRMKPDAILVPKVSATGDLAIDTGGIALWAMIETPLAILNIAALAGAGAACFVMGTNDLIKELRGQHTPDRANLHAALGLSVAAARAHGLAAIDGVFNDIADADGFAAHCRQARSFGFDGKTLIHPSQVGPCNDIFAPSADEVAAARKIIAAFDQPANRDKGAIKLDGRMVERLHGEIARRTVALADAIARMG